MHPEKATLVFNAMIILIDFAQFNRNQLYELMDNMMGYRSNGDTWDMMKRLDWPSIQEDGTRMEKEVCGA